MNVHDETTRDLRNLARWRQTARVLVEALPYILAYDNKTIVVKYGGHAMDDGLPTEFAQDVVAIERQIVRELAEAGCSYIQVDAPSYTAYVDPPSRRT